MISNKYSMYNLYNPTLNKFSSFMFFRILVFGTGRATCMALLYFKVKSSTLGLNTYSNLNYCLFIYSLSHSTSSPAISQILAVIFCCKTVSVTSHSIHFRLQALWNQTPFAFTIIISVSHGLASLDSVHNMLTCL